MKKLLSAVLAAALFIGLLPVSALAQTSDSPDAGTKDIVREYGNYSFIKISNPEAGPGAPDGINTNDVTGFAANRLNSYAWAVASRGDSIYIGTNRTMFGSALNTVAEMLHQKHESITRENLNALVSFITGGEVPVDLSEEDYIPQIIRFDVNSGRTAVIYQPAVVRGADGMLYYADKNGALIPDARVVSENASFRSVVEFKGNLYFGSLGTNMLQLIRVDAEDHTEVVFQTLGIVSSLRACCVYGEGEEKTVFFGGQDTTYRPWLAYRQDPAHAGDGVMPIVIRRLDPATAGTDNEDWSGIVADFRDFGQYAAATVYSSGGGNVWDLCSFNGNMYIILAYDKGWAMFRGEKAAPGDPEANSFGWKWTEIVGENSIYGYPLAMDERIGPRNEELRQAYGCSEYAASLNGAGLLDSTATPYVYQGRMYIGSFDNATCIQAQTIMKIIAKLSCLTDYPETGDAGPTLSQIYAPIYEVLSHPQRVWVMDENEQITPAEGINALLRDTTNDYVWRFAELDGKLYAGTLDAATAYHHYLNLSDLLEMLKGSNPALPTDQSAQAGSSAPGQLPELVNRLLASADVEGLQYLAMARALVKHAEGGFDLFVTEDGEHWEPIVRDGLGDSRNYGARTFTVFQGALYIGTANPYYGAQLWKITDMSDARRAGNAPVLTGKVSEDGTCLSYAVSGAADKSFLLVSRYDGDRITATKVVSLNEAADGTLTLRGSGGVIRLRLVSGHDLSRAAARGKAQLTIHLKE